MGVSNVGMSTTADMPGMRGMFEKSKFNGDLSKWDIVCISRRSWDFSFDMFLGSPCSLCDHVPAKKDPLGYLSHECETECRKTCVMPGTLAPTLPLVLI